MMASFIFKKINQIFVLGFIAFLLSPFFDFSAFAAVTNVLGNPGFEQPLGGAGNWDNTANRGILQITGGAPEGNSFLRLSEPATTLAGPPAFVGVFTFQTVIPASPGNTVGFSGLVRVNALTPGEVAQLRIEFQTAAGVFISDAIVSVSTISTTFSRVSVTGVAPAGTGQVTFTIRIQPSTAGDAGGVSIADFDAMEGTINSSPIVLTANLSSSRLKPGGMAIANVSVQNNAAGELTNVQLTANPPAGININTTGTTFAGQEISTRSGSVIFQLGNIAPNQNGILAFAVVATSAVTPGKTYSMTLQATSTLGNSQQVTLQISIDHDPMFTQGTIIGKVFNDLNQNTVQDKGEKGVPFVRLATEEGIVVITDENGKYHIPAVSPGRHLVKIDGHTLPEGTKFVSEESYLTKMTPGIMEKVNFAVLLPPSGMPEEYKEDLTVMITQGLDTSRPSMDVVMTPDTLRRGYGYLEKEPAFQFKLNYGDVINKWYLEIRDELGREIWTGFGVGTPPAEVMWNGQDESGQMIRPGIYSYRFKVADKKGHEDWTLLHFFRVVNKTDSIEMANKPIEIPTTGDFNIFKDGKQSIPLVAKPTVRVVGKTKPENQITVNGYPVTVDINNGMFQTEMYVSPGEKEITVVSTTPEGESTSYRQVVKVKDSMFFMVALGEQQLGQNWYSGNVETVGNSDEFKDGFYENGRLSYYLRAKLKGKFLIKSSYDTSRNNPGLFRDLDPDNYYPIYGDNSARDYDGIDTHQKLYFVVEMDRSFAKWGSFKTAFNDTELASYDRTLSGLKVHYETVGTTPYGDPERGFKLFWAESGTQADHNEFAATGGVLYYTRNRNLIEGGEKIRVEIRDKIQDIAVGSYDLMEGRDYEIDYQEGRIMLTKPLSSVSATDTLTSTDILDGNPVYLIVDYEYDAGNPGLTPVDRGIRGYTHVGDHVRIGGTLVEENRHDGNEYDLQALDLTIKLGRNTKIVAEYATTIAQQTDQAVSYNGGLSFADVPLTTGQNTRPRENAYTIKAESKPIEGLEVSGYIQNLEPSFSVARISSQEGTKKYGVNVLYKFVEQFYARYRYDSGEVSDQLFPLQDNNVLATYENLESHTAQLVYDDGKYLGELEYNHRRVSLPPNEALLPTVLSAVPYGNAVSLKVGYRFNERMLPYAKIQTTFDGGKPDNQFGGGLRYSLTRTVAAYIEQMFGNIGDSTYFGFEKLQENGARNYVNLKMFDRGIGSRLLTTAVGSSFPLSEKSRLYSEKEYSSYFGEEGYADIIGYDGHVGEKWDYAVKFERRHIKASTSRAVANTANLSLTLPNTFNVISTGVGYTDNDRFKEKFYIEFRREQSGPNMWQVVLKNFAEYKLTRDLTFLSNLTYGISRFTDPGNTPADFTEFNNGFSYRPLDYDKLNFLFRYAYIKNLGNDIQFQNSVYNNLYNGVQTDETSNIISFDMVYDFSRYLGIADKIAFKHGTLNSTATDEIAVNDTLLAHRFNFHVTRKWDLALEYRVLFQAEAAKTFRQGAVVEVDREFFDYARLGVGFNFADFDDDLRKSNNYDSYGPFVRMTGKF